ncbi:MAG TPA: hypothetical protein VKE41_18805 [Roseiflexaceae bacterium]|nr:hypothetical protein [Roseiflexaceae bacterium]
MQQPPRFQAGDQVRTLAWIDILPIDTKGRVVGNYPTVDLYDVHFDGEHTVRVVRGSVLELVARGRRAAKTDRRSARGRG